MGPSQIYLSIKKSKLTTDGEQRNITEKGQQATILEQKADIAPSIFFELLSSYFSSYCFHTTLIPYS